ncbi:tyrosine-type recombinase/integrase [Aquirufa aurantiipilula]|nr:tyrosine-type recombinase/integrase [Aquirufa aurantiipilula]
MHFQLENKHMYQFFYIRKSKSNSKIGIIYKAVYDNRTPISRDSLKISIPIKYWDDKKQEVKVHSEVEYEKINYLINQHKSEFLAANKKAVRTNRDCFIEFAKEHLEKEYSNVGTKIKYTTVLNSLKKYVQDVLGKDSLTFEELRKIDFIGGYKKWVLKRQYNNRDESISKRTKTIFNYVVVIQTFVKKYNQLNPEKDEIKTIHYTSGIENFDNVEPKMLYPDEIDRLINYNTISVRKTDKTIAAKYQFLFQFFASGLRVSDILLLNFKHFVKGRIEFIVKKNGKKISIPFSYKASKMLGHFYPNEFEVAKLANLLGDIELKGYEVEELININSHMKPLEDLTIDDLVQFQQFLIDDRTEDNSKRLKVLKDIIIRVEILIAKTMSDILGDKPSGLVFDYLDYNDFNDLRIMDKKDLSNEQNYKLHRARTTYNGRLNRIAKRIGVDKITSHVSRHSFAYYMLSTGASVEEISFALGHASIEITQSYIKQFPSRYSDEAISRFGANFNV